MFHKSTMNMKTTRPKYKFVQALQEDHKQPLFSVQFSPFATYDLFASCGSNRVTIYRIEEGKIQPALCFADPNVNETFYCCAWAVNSKTLDQVVCAAGVHAIIRIISPYPPYPVKYLSGHGGAINDIKVMPGTLDILLTASKDHSLRLWNITTQVCIAIFGGVEGHRDEVLSADFHPTGARILSGGLDHALKIWNIEQDILDAIELSRKYNEHISEKSFPTVRKHFPTFSTRDIHENYVDCVTWHGDTVISKSCQNLLMHWRPMKNVNDIKYTSDPTATIINNIRLNWCDLWFVRFSWDAGRKILALGTTKGSVYLLDIDDNSKSTVTIPKCQSTVRQTCFNNDGRILICSCENGTISRFDRLPED